MTAQIDSGISGIIKVKDEGLRNNFSDKEGNLSADNLKTFMFIAQLIRHIQFSLTDDSYRIFSIIS